ncbi:MAG TPA: hypothetical protein VFL57_01515, partial [Bryobacteraceae bacterium]|nr:hypothetical protein [Bryobacteraceae bacterium]
WRDLIFREWWTDETGVTDDSGNFRVRGFLGDYDVEVTLAGENRTFPVKLARAGAAIEVR